MGGMFTERKEKMIKIELNRMILSDIKDGDIAASLNDEEIFPLFTIPVDAGDYYRISKKVNGAFGARMSADDPYGCDAINGKTVVIDNLAVRFNTRNHEITIGVPFKKGTGPITVFNRPNVSTNYYPYRKAIVVNAFVRVVPDGCEYAAIRKEILDTYGVIARPDNHTVLVIGGIGVMFEDNQICFGTNVVVGDW